MTKTITRILFALCLLATLLLCVACEVPPQPGPAVKSIEITAMPTKLSYVEGEKLDLTGIKVTKTYEDGTTADCTDFVADKDVLTRDDATVTISVGDASASFDVEITRIYGIQLLAMPTKTTYVQGETFDGKGMEIYGTLSNGSRVKLSHWTIDSETLALGDTHVTVKYLDYTLDVSVVVVKSATPRQVADVEFSTEAEQYVPTMDPSSFVKYKVVYTDGTKDEEWTNALADDYKGYHIDDKGENIVIELELFVKNVLITKSVSYPISTDYLTVSQLLQKGVDGKTYLLDGIIVGFLSTGEAAHPQEFIVYDQAADKYIGVSGLVASGTTNNLDLDTNGFKVGQHVRLPVTLVDYNSTRKDYASYSDSGKVFAKYAGGALHAAGILQQNATYTIATQNAVQISTQDDLVNFLKEENRSNNFYKLVKINGPFNVVRYSDSYWRFFLDPTIDNVADQKIDGLSPAMQKGNLYYTLGEPSLGNFFVGDANAKPGFGKHAVVNKNMYMLFGGGNNYYHQFIVLDYSHVTNVERNVTSTTFTAPTKVDYLVGETFSMEGAKLTVKYDKGSDDVITVTASMITSALPDMTTAGSYTVNGSCNGKEFSFTVKVSANSVSSVELATALTKGEYSVGDGAQAVVDELTKLQLKVNKADGSHELVNITKDMITSGTWQAGSVDFTIEHSGKTTTVTVTVNQSTDLSVKQARNVTASDTVYKLTGVVVSSAWISGTASSPNNGEVFLKDVAGNEVIGVKDMGISYESPLAGLAVGDEITVSVTFKVTTTGTASESGKVTAHKVADTTAKVNSTKNSAQIALSSAVTISSQAELEAFLKDAETRVGNMYKLVKLTAGAKFINYNNGRYITFNDKATKIDDMQPYLHDFNRAMTLPSTVTNYSELLDLKADNTSDATVYLMYVGGQGKYYHQFILLGSEYVVK